ncbi:hypothetical protein LDENG_00186130 [Lucifuga dentata]|nr:hypothetical protein LDENG_00186130 [Lucifuga dentata]
MADGKNTNMEVDKEDEIPSPNKVTQLPDEITHILSNDNAVKDKEQAGESHVTTVYCEKLQAWMWQYHTGVTPSTRRRLSRWTNR